MGVRLSYREDASGLEWERELGGGLLGVCVCVYTYKYIRACIYYTCSLYMGNKLICFCETVQLTMCGS